MQDFTFRLANTKDGKALNQLCKATPDTGMVQFALQFLIDPIEAFNLIQDRHKAFVVETADYEGFVGLSSVKFGQLNIDDKSLPFGLLNNLKVHPDFRRKGIAKTLADWGAQETDKEFGKNCVKIA